MDRASQDDGDEGFAEDNTPDDELVPMDVNLTAGAEGEGQVVYIVLILTIRLHNSVSVVIYHFQSAFQQLYELLGSHCQKV